MKVKACPFCKEDGRYLVAKPGFYSERVCCDTCHYFLPLDRWNHQPDKDDNVELRFMLALNYSKHLYTDDGELQDNSVHPCIDFKRDSVEDIQAKMRQRAINYMQANPNFVKLLITPLS